MRRKTGQTASRYDLQLVYGFGSRAKEALDLIDERVKSLSSKAPDLDIGIKPGKE